MADDTNTNPHALKRRSFLVAIGALAGASVIGATESTAYGDTLSSTPTTWRRAMAAELLATTADLTVRPLQTGLELWEAGNSGYMIIDPTTRTPMEYSSTALSPFHASSGELSYLGPGLYFASRADRSVNLFTGRRSKSSALRAVARDAADQFHENAVPLKRAPASSKVGMKSVGTYALDPVTSSNVKSRVTSY